VLTSFVGEVLGPTVGLDDGCSEDREQKISIVSSVMLKYPQNVKRRSIQHSACICTNVHITDPYLL